jgi:hypothetical protein
VEWEKIRVILEFLLGEKLCSCRKRMFGREAIRDSNTIFIP